MEVMSSRAAISSIDFFGDVAVLALGQVQQRHHRRTLLLGRVFGKNFFHFIRIFFGKHRSSHVGP